MITETLLPTAASPSETAPKNRNAGRRLQAFDAARGIAVLFMCLSHFVVVYFQNPTHIQRIVTSVCMIASPTFIILSGVMLGFLGTSDEESFQRLRFKLTDRAIFLLTVTHVLITIAMWPTDHAASHGWGRSSITDAVAGAILLSLWTPRRTHLRVGMGVAGLAFSWAVVLMWHPSDTLDVALKELLFGAPSFQVFTFSWPVMPWASAYIICTVLGGMMGRRRHDPGALVRLCYAAAGCSLALAAAWGVVGKVLSLAHHGANWSLTPIFSPWAKFPPSPEYFLVFGGFALILIATVLWCANNQWFEPLTREAARVGRCSLVLFVAQSFVYYTGLTLFRLPASPLWPLMFLVTLVPMYALAWFWDREKLNGLLSVGLEGLLTKLHRDRSTAMDRLSS